MKAENGSGAIICWKDKVLLFHRDNIPTIPAPNCWHLPGGGMEKEETPLETIRRELMEEVSHVPQMLNFLVTLKRNDGSLSHIYYSFVDDDEAILFKIGPGEGQGIGFFTVEEMFSLKLTPMMENYLLPLKKDIEKAMETKDFSALVLKLKDQPDEY